MLDKDITKPTRANEIENPTEQAVEKNVYILGEFDKEGNFLRFLDTHRVLQNQLIFYVGNNSARNARNSYRRLFPEKVIEAMWVEKLRVARFYNKTGKRTASNIFPKHIEERRKLLGRD